MPLLRPSFSAIHVRNKTLNTVLLLGLLAGSFAAHADSEWAGNGLTTNWTNPFNWSGGVPDKSPSENVLFSLSNSGLSHLNENWTLGGLELNSGGSRPGESEFGVRNGSVLTIHQGISYGFPGCSPASTLERCPGMVYFPIKLGDNAGIETKPISRSGDPDNKITFYGSINTNGKVLVLRPFGADIVINAPITGSGRLQKDGGGTARLTKPNTYTGSTTVLDGDLIAGVGARIHDASDLRVFGNGRFLMASNTADAINGLYGDGQVGINTGNTLVIGNYDGFNSVGSGNFTGDLFGTGGNLSKRGKQGTQILNGAINLGGDINIEEGTLVFGSSSTLNQLPEIAVQAGARLDILNDATYDVISNFGGTINVNGDITVRNIRNGFDTQFNINGGIISAEILGIAGGFINNQGGTLNPGNSPGKMLITGDLQQGSAASIFIELGGTTPEVEYDVIEVLSSAGTTGKVTLDGTLDVVLYNGFIPEAGDSFDILTAPIITGEFSIINLPTVQGILWELQTLVDEIGSTDVLRLTALAQPIPLPASVWLLFSSIGILFISKKR